MRNALAQLKYYSNILKEKDSFTKLYDQAQSIKEQLKNWEKELIQPNQKTFQDVINFNNKLNAELMHLKGYVDTDDPKVTQGAKDRYRDLNETWQKHKDELKKIIEDDFRSFEENYRAAKVPVLNVEIDSL
jgi:regulator of replication initiation timing